MNLPDEFSVRDVKARTSLPESQEYAASEVRFSGSRRANKRHADASRTERVELLYVTADDVESSGLRRSIFDRECLKRPALVSRRYGHHGKLVLDRFLAPSLVILNSLSFGFLRLPLLLETEARWTP